MYYDFDDKLNSNDPAADVTGSGTPDATPDPAVTEPVYMEPDHSEPEYAEPQSSVAEPVYTEPVYTEPAPTDAGARQDAGKPYYEPWREPVYRDPDERVNAYTPGPSLGSTRAAAQPRRPAIVEKPLRRRHGFLRALCLILVCALVASAASYGVLEYRINRGDFKTGDKTVVLGAQNGNASGSASPSGSASTTPLISTGSEMSAADVYKMACEQVVGIKTAVTTTNIFGQTTSGAVSGSGFIISNDGYIVTNYHVIEYAVIYGYDLTVMLHDGTAYTAKIIGYEKDNDVAVIKIDAAGLNAVTMGVSSDMIVGEKVYAVGNPLGELEYTMTSGIVSALDRVITTSDTTTETTTSINMFQIDAAVNSGNSGGPVYNAKGEVIGIVSAKYSRTGVEGLGFAIPIDDALAIVSDLIENGYVTGKAYFGITVQTITASYAQYYGIVEGACVMSVNDGSCAEAAGLQEGDIITKLGDYDVKTRDELLNAKKNFKAGDTAAVTVYRGSEYLNFVVTFDEETASSDTAAQAQPSQQLPRSGQIQ